MWNAEDGMRKQEKEAGSFPDVNPNSACLRATHKQALRTPRRGGFTLIELVIVIVVLGIMLTLVIPRLGELGEADLKQSARRLTGMIRFLSDEARTRKEVYRMRFDIQNGRYWAEVLTRTSDRTTEFRRFRSVLANETSLSGRTTFRSVKAGGRHGDPYILFTPDGWVERASIHIRDGDGKDFTLLVRPFAGSTELVEGYVEER